MSFSSLIILIVCAVACGALELNGNDTISTFPSHVEDVEEVVYIEEEEVSDLNFKNLRDGKFPKSSSSTKARIDVHHRVLASDATIKKWQDFYNNILFNHDDVVVTVTYDFFGTPYDDKFMVKYEENICYIYAQDTNEPLDWRNNMKSTTMKIIDSGYTTTETYKYWYWKKWGWAWRWTYENRTRRKTILDEGVAGFVGPFNVAAKAVKAAVESTCKDATKYQYIGYSRGGGLAQIMALHHFRNGLFKNVDTSLVLFNAPNALKGWSSNALENNLDEAVSIVRFGGSSPVYFVDPANMLPPGYKKPGSELFVRCSSANSVASAHKCGGGGMEGKERKYDELDWLPYCAIWAGFC